MKNQTPYHAHIYYEMQNRSQAAALRDRLKDVVAKKEIPELCYVGTLRDQPVGPHPIPQFEIHFTEPALAKIESLIKSSGLQALVHPLTQDDLADHTTLARWIGKKLELDLTVLDPPGKNQGVGRFSKSDF